MSGQPYSQEKTRVTFFICWGGLVDWLLFYIHSCRKASAGRPLALLLAAIYIKKRPNKKTGKRGMYGCLSESHGVRCLALERGAKEEVNFFHASNPARPLG